MAAADESAPAIRITLRDIYDTQVRMASALQTVAEAVPPLVDRLDAVEHDKLNVNDYRREQAAVELWRADHETRLRITEAIQAKQSGARAIIAVAGAGILGAGLSAVVALLH